MKRINIAGMYYIGHSVHALTGLKDVSQTYDDVWGVLYNADKALAMIEKLDGELNLSVSRAVYKELHGAVKEALAAYRNNSKAQVGYKHSWEILRQAERFESVFAAEFEVINTYAVAHAMAYNVRTLIDSGEEVIHETLRGYLPDVARKDVREATRCLAYQLNTAVGFHILRAVEATLMAYFDLLGIAKPTRPAEKNLGNYINLLRAAGVDDKILLPLDQIRAFHRNVLMHPDRSLDNTEASSLFEVSKAALTAMLIDIKERTLATSVAASASTATV